MRFLTFALTMAAVLWSAPCSAHDAASRSGLAPGTPVWAVGARTSVTISVNPNGSGHSMVRVSQGTRLHLTVRGAGAGKLHLQGYDITVDVEKGQPALFVIDAIHAGRFEMTNHVEDSVLGDRETTVLYFEVRSR